MLKQVFLLVCFIAVTFGQPPPPPKQNCDTPSRWSGDFFQSGYFARQSSRPGGGIEMMNDRRFAHVDYDYTNQRFRIREFVDDGSPFPGPNNREYTDIELYLYNEHKSYHVVMTEGGTPRCTERTLTGEMTPFGPPEAATKRYTSYVGAGSTLPGDGVKVDVYSTTSPGDEENHFHGNFAPYITTIGRSECIPVTIGRRATENSPGRQENAMYEHLVFYNITGSVDISAFTVQSSWDCRPSAF